MSMHRKDPTEAVAAVRGDAITITTEQCIKAWREAVSDWERERYERAV